MEEFLEWCYYKSRYSQRNSKAVFQMKISKILYVFWKIIGLCPFVMSRNGKIRFSYGGVFYAIALASVYLVCWVRAMKNRLLFSKPRETTMSIIADILGKSAQFVMAVTTWLSFGFRQNGFRSLQKSYDKFTQTCVIIGIRDVPCNFMRNETILVVIYNFLWGGVLICGHYQHSKTSTYKVFTWMQFNFGRIVYPNFMLIFVIAMNLIRDRFRSLNDAIGELSRVDLKRPAVCERRRENNSRIELLRESSSLSTYIQLRSDLVEVTTSVVEFFSVPVYLTMVAYILELASSLYVVSLTIKYEQFWWNKNSAYFWALNVWQMCHIIGLIALFIVPDSTGQEANRTGNVLHEFLTSRSSRRDIEGTTMESLGLLQRRLIIQLFGVLDIKSSTIYMIIGLIISYITIMIQLDDQNSEKASID